jgi:hypothetical protein
MALVGLSRALIVAVLFYLFAPRAFKKKFM